MLHLVQWPQRIIDFITVAFESRNIFIRKKCAKQSNVNILTHIHNITYYQLLYPSPILGNTFFSLLQIVKSSYKILKFKF